MLQFCIFYIICHCKIFGHTGQNLRPEKFGTGRARPAPTPNLHYLMVEML